MRPAGDGVYYETTTAAGEHVNGMAPDIESATRAVEAARGRGRDGLPDHREGFSSLLRDDARRLYSCQHCAQTVEFDQAQERWKHSYPDPGANPLLCNPNRPDGTKAFPAAPASRDRKYIRGLWPAVGSRSECDPE